MKPKSLILTVGVFGLSGAAMAQSSTYPYTAAPLVYVLANMAITSESTPIYLTTGGFAYFVWTDSSGGFMTMGSSSYNGNIPAPHGTGQYYMWLTAANNPNDGSSPVSGIVGDPYPYYSSAKIFLAPPGGGGTGG